MKSLLDKSKVTTIRKSFERYTIQPELVSFIHKPCKYKVGEEVELVWTGEPNQLVREWRINNPLGRTFEEFQYGINIGKVKIKSIDKIDVSKYGVCKYSDNGNPDIDVIEVCVNGVWSYTDDDEETKKDLDNLAKKDGFNDIYELVDYLEKYAGSLEYGKEFYLIEWEWI